jgi:hypothetical protein
VLKGRVVVALWTCSEALVIFLYLSKHRRRINEIFIFIHPPAFLQTIGRNKCEKFERIRTIRSAKLCGVFRVMPLIIRVTALKRFLV